jgi:peroxiredoxin
MLHTIRSRRAPHAGAHRILPAAGVALALAVLAPAPARAQTPDKIPPVVTPPTTSSAQPSKGTPVPRIGRMLVGDAAPDVKLNDHEGRLFHLATARRDRAWLLVFLRKPENIVDPEAAAGGLAALGLGAVVIAPFGADRVQAWAAKPRLPLLFDRASFTARTYGLYDPLTSNPRPGAYLVDQKGRIVWLMSGALPSGPELVRLAKEAMEAHEGEAAAAEATE